MDFSGRTTRRFSYTGRSRLLQNETLLLEKRLEEMRTVMQVDRHEMDLAKENKFIWQGGRSGKLRQFKYGKKKKQAAEKAAENGTTLKPHAPATKGADVNSEKENILASRSKTPPPKPKKETHEMSISTSPIPIEEEDLVSNPIPPQEEQSSGLWFPGAACVPQTPETHEISVATDPPPNTNLPMHKLLRENLAQSKNKAKDGQKQLVNSYFAKLYLSKSLNDSKKK